MGEKRKGFVSRCKQYGSVSVTAMFHNSRIKSFSSTLKKQIFSVQFVQDRGL